MLIGSILLGCSDRYAGDESINTVKSNKVNAVRVADLSRVGIFDTDGFYKQGNKLIVGTSTMDGFIRSLDLDHLEQDNSAARSIPSSKRLRSLSSFNSFDGSSVTALDFIAGELVESATAPLARGESKESVIRLPAGQQHLIAVKAKDLVISTGFYEEGRYLLYSLVDGSARYFLSYPETPQYPDLQQKTKAMLYGSSILRIRPDQSAFVCADMYSGLIDFCRVEADSIYRVKTVCLHYPKVNISESPSLRVAYYRDNRFGFSDIAVTNDKVYALYSGKSCQEAGSRVTECQTLLVYDWEGVLEQCITLDMNLVNIVFDPMEEMIYGITATQFELVNIPL